MSTTKLYRLRDALIDVCMDALKHRRVIGVDNNGQDVLEPIAPAMLNVIRQTLSDNGITREPLDADYTQTVNVESLPFEDTITLPTPPLVIEHTAPPAQIESALTPSTGQQQPVIGKKRRHIKNHE